EAGARVDLADGVHGGNGGAHQLMLELEAAAPCHRVEVGNVAARPGPEGYLVRRRVERHPVALILDQLRHRSGVAGEMLDGGRAPDIDVIRPAVMAQIPDDLATLPLGGLQHRQEARPVILPRRRFDQVPAQAITDAAQPVPAQQRVILFGPLLMTGHVDQVQPSPIAAPVVRALEAAEKKTVKQTRLVHPDSSCALPSRYPVSPGYGMMPRPYRPGRAPRYACTTPAPGRPPGPCCSTCRCRAGRGR